MCQEQQSQLDRGEGCPLDQVGLPELHLPSSEHSVFGFSFRVMESFVVYSRFQMSSAPCL